MRRYAPIAVLATSLCAAPARAQQPTMITRDYRAAADRIIDGALADSSGFVLLTELVDRFGHRFSGSESLERAIELDPRRDAPRRIPAA